MIASVTVCYRPDLPTLERQITALRDQVNTVWVIENGPAQTDLAKLCQKWGATLISLGRNTGLAHAQNTGLKQAAAQGSSMILLMDQDSEPQALMVTRLAKALTDHPHAAAAGPCTLDMRTQQYNYFLVDDDRRPRQWTPPTDAPHATVEAAYLITSGTLLRVSALKDIGDMQADWFIDHIDTEWCLRARSKGWHIIGVADAVLGHRLGEHMTTVWWLRKRQVPHHSPLRHYYMFRNTVLLVRKPFVPWHWKRHHVVRLLKLGVFFLALAPLRGQRLRMMAQGLWDGVCGRTGAKEAH